MKFFSLAVGLLTASTSDALKVRAGMWGPGDLKMVDGVLEHILSMHMTPEMHARAQVVAADVKKDIAAISTGRNLTKAERQSKVAAAITELGHFQEEMEKETDELTKEQKYSNMTAKMVKLGNKLDPKVEQKYEEKKAELEKKLHEKQGELEKDEKEIQLYKLKKELAEKQLELNNLEMDKAKDAMSKKTEVEDSKAQQEMVKNLLSIATGLKGQNQTVVKLPPQMNAILADLLKRSASMKAGLAKLDETQKKSEADLDAALTKQVGTKGSSDVMSKAQAMIKSLKKKEERKFQKVRAVKKNQANELDSAIESIQKMDIGALQKVLGKMQAETKATDAKSGHFLY
jgi:hypothetical protein